MILMKLCTEIRDAHEGIWGLWVGYCCVLSFGLSAWRKWIYTLHMRERCETWNLWNFMESILCLCVVAICVNWFGMIEFCLVCLVVGIRQGWGELSAWSV